MLLARKGKKVTLLSKTARQYEGVIVSTTEREGARTGVTLRDVKELTAPGASVKSQFFLASTNIISWSPVPTNSNTSTPQPPPISITIDEIMNKLEARRLLQTLPGLGLTVCDIYDAHIAFTHSSVRLGYDYHPYYQDCETL
jgi:hypothetical protein